MKYGFIKKKLVLDIARSYRQMNYYDLFRNELAFMGNTNQLINDINNIIQNANLKKKNTSINLGSTRNANN